MRRNSANDLAERLVRWLVEANRGNDCETSIARGLEIEGLGVSFASKHLRLLAPNVYPVLDQVLSEGLGFALNPKGYALFQALLEEFKDKNGLTYSIADLEGGIFLLVRQHVRASTSRAPRSDA